MSEPLFLGLDLGASRCRIAVARGDGELLPEETWPALDSTAAGHEGRLKRRLLSPGHPLGTAESQAVRRDLARVLAEARARAARHAGADIEGAIISVPPVLSDAGRDLVIRAAAEAGFPRASLYVDAGAALLDHAREASWRGRAAVVSLGETSFSVSIYDVSPEAVNARTHTTRPGVCGIDLDGRLLSLLRNKAGQSTHAPRPESNGQLRAAEKLRVELSHGERATAKVGSDGSERRIELSRRDFEEFIAPDLEQMQTALDEAQQEAGSVDGAFLLGGVTQTPCIERLVREKFQGNLRRLDASCVARGAALVALSFPPAPVARASRPAMTREVAAGIRAGGEDEPGATASYLAALQAAVRRLPPDEAVKALEDLRDLVRQWLAEGYFRRGELLGRLGRLDSSISDYMKAKELDPTNSTIRDALAEVHYRRAEFNRQTGRSGVVKHDLDTCLRYRPGYRPALERLEELRSHRKLRKHRK